MKMSERKEVTHVSYTISQCASDIRDAEQKEAYVRGALISAAKKRLKAEITLDWIFKVSKKLDLDMTPVFATNIAKGWIGRGISRAMLKKIFSVPSRSAGNKCTDTHQLKSIVSDYKEDVVEEIELSFIELNKLIEH